MACEALARPPIHGESAAAGLLPRIVEAVGSAITMEISPFETAICNKHLEEGSNLCRGA
jgi:hypothetical protein